MLKFTEIVKTFPSITINNKHDSAPIEISVIAQLGHGAGNQIFSNTTAHQTNHDNFIDELDEPSAKLSDISPEYNDPASLYSFAVGPKGHPFHRHAGNRIFTAISGSGGSQLRFSTASSGDIKQNPQSFIEQLHFINIPPDCLFTVRFGGETWHQFAPLSKNTLHPVFFALSCHTNELGGNLSESLKNKVLSKDADIPSLTELPPKEVIEILNSKDFQNTKISTTTLAIDAPAGTAQRKVCDTVRGSMGIIRSLSTLWNTPSGYISQEGTQRTAHELKTAPSDSLLITQLQNEHIQHEDTFVIKQTGNFKNAHAS